jgi:hypothetical protein
LLGALILGGLAAVALQRLLRELRGPLEAWPITLTSFGLALGVVAGALGALLLLWYALRTASLTYQLDRNAIYIRRWGSRYTIPLHQIGAVASPDDARADQGRLRFGYGRTAQTLLISTQQSQYRLAVQQRDQFARELEERRQFGIVQAQVEGWSWSWPRLHAFWSASTIRWLLAGIVLLNLAAWGLLAWRYPLLAETIPVRFDPVGGTAGTRSRLYTLLLPAGASGMWLVDLVLAELLYHRARLASELLLLGALLVQAGILVAIWFIITIAR